MSNDDGIDTLTELCRDAGVEIAPDDGILLVTVSKSGTVKPTVLQVGLMTEGRIEGAIMGIYHAIVVARGKAAHEARMRTAPAHHATEIEDMKS